MILCGQWPRSLRLVLALDRSCYVTGACSSADGGHYCCQHYCSTALLLLRTLGTVEQGKVSRLEPPIAALANRRGADSVALAVRDLSLDSV